MALTTKLYDDLPPDFVIDREYPGYPLPKGIIVEKDVLVEVRDGCKLACNVFRPDKTGKFPVILSFTVYGKDVYGWHKAYGVSEACPFEGPDPGFWVPNDYVVILFDTRGFGKSPGERRYMYPVEDFYDAIEWAGTQGWSNGNVGMSGVSYLGAQQYYAAAAQPPHLKAIIPWEALIHPMPPYGGMNPFGGIPETVFMTQVIKVFPPLNPALHQTQGPLEVKPAVLENIATPALFCATWGDQCVHTRGTLLAYQGISTPPEHKWLYTHGRQKWEEYCGAESQDIQKKFFDYFLKGIDSGIMDIPRVRLEARETYHKYAVRWENEFPLAGTEYTKLYLNANTGTLNFDEVSQEGKISYDSAAGNASFDIKFDRDTELTGHMNLKLWVSPEDADDMDLFITLWKLDTKGNRVYFDWCHAWCRFPVSLGWLRMSWRELDPELSTPWQPVLKFETQQKVNSGEIVPCEIEIIASSTLFREGESLRLIISGQFGVETEWFSFGPLVNEGKHSIYTGGKYDSYLLVPVSTANPSGNS
jgi:predicted acyl esterase